MVKFTDTDYSATLLDRVILVDTSAGQVTISLPTKHLAGRTYDIKDYFGTAPTNPIVITSQGTDLIDDETNFFVVQEKQSIRVVSDGKNWHVI